MTRWKTTWWLVACWVAAGCGDNVLPPPGPGEQCHPPEAALPTEGAFADPVALSPAGCVVGGLIDLPGRWFLVDPTALFDFSYPKYEGDCDGGFRRAFDPPDDPELGSDNSTFHTFNDGTRIYSRRYFKFVQPEQVFEFARARVVCMRDDGTLIGTSASLNFDGMVHMGSLTGRRFDAREPTGAVGLVRVGELGTRNGDPQDHIAAYNVVIDGDRAYTVGPGGLDIYDVSTPAAPVTIGFVPGGYNDVRVVRGGGKVVAFASPLAGNENTHVIDVTDPAAPIMLADLAEFSHSVQVVTSGATKLLYLATYTNGVPRYDVTDPSQPVRLGEAIIPDDVASDGVHDLTIDGDTIYANYTTGGFVAFDVSAGLANPVRLGRIPTSYSHASAIGTLTNGRRIILHGDEGMTGTPDGAAFMRVIDGNRASPTYMMEIGRYQTRREVGIHNIELVGNRAYIAYYQDGVRVVDLTTPEQPVEVAHFNTWNPETAPGSPFEGAIGIRLANGHVFVADTERGLVILKE